MTTPNPRAVIITDLKTLQKLAIEKTVYHEQEALKKWEGHKSIPTDEIVSALAAEQSKEKPAAPASVEPLEEIKTGPIWKTAFEFYQTDHFRLYVKNPDTLPYTK
jgi:hypothetical protein